jgi:hypothetical protein
MKRLSDTEVAALLPTLTVQLAARLAQETALYNRTGNFADISDQLWQDILNGMTPMHRKITELSDQANQLFSAAATLQKLSKFGITDQVAASKHFYAMLEDQKNYRNRMEEQFVEEKREFFRAIQLVFPDLTEDRLIKMLAFT